MSQGAPTSTDSSARALGMLLAALAPLLAALPSSPAFVSASGGGHALHAALALSCAAPPGHPLAVLLLRAGTLVPLGPLALRAALVGAGLVALAAAALYLAIDGGLRASTALRPLVASPLALGLTLLVFGAGPLPDEIAMPDAAALALACLGLSRWVAFACAWPRLDLSALRAAALLLGLLLAEQPALAAAVLCFALPVLYRARREFRLPWWNLAPLLVGVPLWLYAALARAPALGLAHARSPLALLQAAFALPPAERTPALDATSAPAELLPLALAALGVLGGALALRAPAQRKLGVSWLAIGAGALAAGHWFAHDAGLRALALCAAAALAAFALAPLLAGDGKRQLAPLLAVLLLVALGVGQLHTRARAQLALQRAASDALGDPLRRDLPARSALLLARDSAQAFADAESEERVRPDLLAVLAPWQLDLRDAERIAARHPELLPLLRAQLLARPHARPGSGAGAPEPPLVELAALAARRPTLIELQPGLDPALHAAVLPYGLYHQVSTYSLGKADVELAARDAERRLVRLYGGLDVARLDAAARWLLAQRHRAEIAYAATVGNAQIATRAQERLGALQARAQP